MKKEKLAEELRWAESDYQNACGGVEEYRKKCMRHLTERDDLDEEDFIYTVMRLCEWALEKYYAGEYVEALKKLDAEERRRRAESDYQNACGGIEDCRKECMRFLTERDDLDEDNFIFEAMNLCGWNLEKFYAGRYVEVLKKLEAEDMEVRGVR